MVLLIFPLSIIMGVCCAYLLTQILYDLSNNYGDATGSFKDFTGGGPAMHYIEKKTLSRKEFKEL